MEATAPVQRMLCPAKHLDPPGQQGGLRCQGGILTALAHLLEAIGAVAEHERRLVFPPPLRLLLRLDPFAPLAALCRPGLPVVAGNRLRRVGDRRQVVYVARNHDSLACEGIYRGGHEFALIQAISRGLRRAVAFDAVAHGKRLLEHVRVKEQQRPAHVHSRVLNHEGVGLVLVLVERESIHPRQPMVVRKPFLDSPAVSKRTVVCPEGAVGEDRMTWRAAHHAVRALRTGRT